MNKFRFLQKIILAVPLALALLVTIAWAQGPTNPEQMSGKTALEFFADNEIKAGWNLGNTLDAVNNNVATEGQWSWGGPGAATQALFNGVKESGFDIVRIPVTWLGHIGSAPDYTISEARLQRVAEIIGYAKTAGIKAMIINIHHDGNYTQPDKGTWGFLDFAGAVNDAAKKNAIQNQIGVIWTQIANYFKNYGDYLIFETMNEVHQGNWGNGSGQDYQKQQDILFDWNQAALSAIRTTGGNNATRFVAVPGLGSTEPATVINANSRGKLLPNDGTNIGKLIVSVHYYHPWRYTVADISNQAEPLLHTWGTTAERAHPGTAMASLKNAFINNGVAVYIGEWGAQTNVRSSMQQEIKETHLEYIKSVATAAEANSILPIYWDDGGNFKMLERSNGLAKAGFWSDVLSEMMGVLKSNSSNTKILGDNILHIIPFKAVIYNLKGGKVSGILPNGVYIVKSQGMQPIKLVVTHSK
ncbi:MAG: glycoside hydrolase family 5 protein [Fibromonadaceae bacterium]|jgi:aryl-phospho-beta-D-glucosidase BglC (GH1 family)|nr:glycoside hydrolase family 5 protein [Fibromonadaceae bacterium]